MYAKQKQRRKILAETIEELKSSGVYPRSLISEQCATELDRLITKPFFNRFNPTIDTADISDLDFNATIYTI
jgi:hypothetical protein